MRFFNPRIFDCFTDIKYGNKVMSMPEHSSTREAQICILLLKSKTRWADQLIRKLSLEFSVFPIYALPKILSYFTEKGYVFKSID